MLLSACDTSGLDPATADQVNQGEMTAAVGLMAVAFGGDAYRDAGLQVATASLNDAAQRRSAAEAAPVATGSPIQGEPPRWTRPQRPRQAHPGPAPGNATSGRNAARQAAGFATIPTGCLPLGAQGGSSVHVSAKMA